MPVLPSLLTVGRQQLITTKLFTMTSYTQQIYSDEKGSHGSSSADPVEAGYVSNAPKQRFGFKLAVDQEPSSFAATASASNADFDPIPPSKRTWTTGAYFAYWMADGWAVSNWEVGMIPPMTSGSHGEHPANELSQPHL